MAAITKAISSDISATTSRRALTGKFNVSISGATWVATVTLQRSFDGTNWNDVETFTANEEVVVWEEPERNVKYRIGTKNGEYRALLTVISINRDYQPGGHRHGSRPAGSHKRAGGHP